MERKYRLFKEIGQTDEKYIEEMRSDAVAEKIKNKNLIRYGIGRKRRNAVISALAAAAVLAVVCTAVLPQIREADNTVENASQTTEDTDIEMQANNEAEAAESSEEADEETAEITDEAALSAEDETESAEAGGGGETTSSQNSDAEAGGGGESFEVCLSNTETEESVSEENSPPYNTLEIEGVTYIYAGETAEEDAGEYIGYGITNDSDIGGIGIYNAVGDEKGESIVVFLLNDWYLFVKSE